MTDIVERLREPDTAYGLLLKTWPERWKVMCDLCDEAADEIERLQAENGRLREKSRTHFRCNPL